MTNQKNDNNFEDVYEMINQYGIDSMPEAMKILFNEDHAFGKE